MSNSRSLRGVPRSSRSSLRVMAIGMTLALLASTHPWPVLAQDVLNCSVNGMCLSGSINSLLGLPNGTLKIVGYQPWDRVVKGGAAETWAPLEAEARAALAALHGVPNDNRLPYAALDDLRAYMFMRLLSLAKQQATTTTTLTGVERDTLDTLKVLVKDCRVREAQKAIDEYHRWESDPCHYTVPGGFGFEQYDPGPQCGIGGVMLAGPPRPPTKEQFTAYGAALAMKQAEDAIKNAKRKALGISDSDTTFTYDTSADVQATLRHTDEALAIAVGVGAGILVSGIAAIAAAASFTVAATFAAMAGSFSVLGTVPSVMAVGAFASAGVIGVGIAASLPALVIAAAVVAVVYIIQFNEDQSILPMLQEALAKADATPDVWTIAATDLGRVELFSTFVYQTLPSYDEQRLASVVPAPPVQRQPGDPRFEVNGVVQDVIQTWGPAGKLQETFMSQGWFVTRTQQGGTWGPWQWSLTLRYRGPNLSDLGTHTAGIQPAGFFHTYQASTLQVTAATKVTQLQTLNATLGAETVKWTGNRPPKLVPTVSEEPRIGSPVVFSAGASDPDGNPITAIRWFFEDPTINVLRPSFAECSLTPPGRIDPVSGLSYSCPWAAINDSGTGVGYTYATPGTWSVLVMAEDSEGAVSSERFSVTLGNLAPMLTVTNLPFLVLPPAVASTPEGQALSVSGTVNYPALPDGAYGALTTLFIEWGDGQVTRWMYRCNAANQPPAPSDASCVFTVATAAEYRPGPGQTLTPGPWSFNFSHVYAYGQGGLANPAQVKIYAVTTLDAWSQVERVGFTITNVTACGGDEARMLHRTSRGRTAMSGWRFP